MSKDAKKSKTVFVEGNSVTTTSPYEDLRDIELSYLADSQQVSLPAVAEEKRSLRLECLQLAVLSETNDIESVISLAKRYFDFVKTGE